MNLHNKELLNKFYSQCLSKQELVKKFDLEGDTPAAFISKEIDSATKKESADELEDAIVLIFVFDAKVAVEKLNVLLLKHWHYRHEDIASLLQKIKSESSVEYLFNAIHEKYQYLSYYDSYALEVKCIWALGEINSESSRQKLSQLCQSDIDIIKQNAENQLKRLLQTK